MIPRYDVTKEYESNLSEARIRTGLTVKELCKKVNINQQTYSGLNSGIIPPISMRTGAVRQDAQCLADMLDMELADAYPAYFCHFSKDLEISDDEIIENCHPELLSPDFADPEEQLIRKEKKNAINYVLAKLTEQEETVIRLRVFDELTLDQIGEYFDVSRERIRQIEKRAINRLKYRIDYIRENCI